MPDFSCLPLSQQVKQYSRLAEEALHSWMLQGSELSLIKIRENAVFKVQTESGSKYALRIHRAGYHGDAELQSELQWIKALAQGGMDVPRVISTASGQGFIVLNRNYIGASRQIDLFDWVDGRELGSMKEGPLGDQETLLNSFRMIGELAGRVHNVSTAWRIPDGFMRHSWDSEGFVGKTPNWGRFWELPALTADERKLMKYARERVRTDLAKYGQSEKNYGLIHADIVPENVLVDGHTVRLIDFDDSGFGWHMFDIATAIYFSCGASNFDELQASLLDGYRVVRPLSQRDIDQLPLFILTRATTILGWMYTRHETETAQEMTPLMVETACEIAEDYLGA